MKTIWKWIIAIVLILAVGGGLFYAGTLFGNSSVFTSAAGTFGWMHPMMGGRGFGPMMGGGFSGAFLPFMLIGGLFRLLIPLGILALVVYFAYQAGKKAAAPK